MKDRRRGARGRTAKTVVAKVARPANVAPYSDPPTVRRELDAYVSSAAGELGLLSLRPRDKSARSTPGGRASASPTSRQDRAIGGGLKGDLLRTIYTRIAAWITKTATRSCVVSVTDRELIELLPLLVGDDRAEQITKLNGGQLPEASILRKLTSFAGDWSTVIGSGATTRAENSTANVTFHLAGGSGERRFWFSVSVETAEGLVVVVEEPVQGREPPVSLADIVKETSVFLEWAEKILAAARLGDKGARAAVALFRGAITGAKGVALALGVAFLGALLFFALPVRDLQAKVIERIQQLLHYVITNETPDSSLPRRLQTNGVVISEDAHLRVQMVGEKTIVITIKDAAALAHAYQVSQHSSSLPPGARDHIEWEWRIRPQHIATTIYKRTENPQLRVVLDRRNAVIAELAVGPMRVYHLETPVHVPGPGVPPIPNGPPARESFDARDLLVIGDPTTYDAPGHPTEEHGLYRIAPGAVKRIAR